MINEKNCTYLMVGNVTNGYADGGAVDVETMPAGSVALVWYNSGLVAEEGALDASGTYELINKLTDGTIIRSPRFTSADLVVANNNAYSQPAQQVSFLGYDGTTINGFGTITLGETYSVGISLAYTAGEYSQQCEMKHIVSYASDTTQATTAYNLMDSHIKNFGPIRQKYPSILCDRIALTTSVADLGGSGDAVYLTHGSKTVSAWVKDDGAADLTWTADDFTVTADDVINIPSYNGRTFTFTATDNEHAIYIGTHSVFVDDGGAAADNGPLIAAAINLTTNTISTVASATADGATVTITYKEDFRGLPPVVWSEEDTWVTVAVTIATGDAVAVKYVAAATATEAASFELDEPWQGPTGYVYAGTTEATHIGIATLTSDTWGLKFTGIMQPFSPVTDRWTMVEFDVLGGAFESYGTEYKAVKASKGNGNWRWVASLEQYAQGNETFYRNSNYPYTPNRTEAIAGTGGLGYDIITATFKPSITWAATGVGVNSPWTITIATRSGLSYDNLDTPL